VGSQLPKTVLIFMVGAPRSRIWQPVYESHLPGPVSKALAVKSPARVL
jgi:hypothetical protein